MRTLYTVLLFLILFALSPLLAIAVLAIWGVWSLIMLPFRLVAFVLRTGYRALKTIFLLPVRALRTAHC